MCHASFICKLVMIGTNFPHEHKSSFHYQHVYETDEKVMWRKVRSGKQKKTDHKNVFYETIKYTNQLPNKLFYLSMRYLLKMLHLSNKKSTSPKRGA